VSVSSMYSRYMLNGAQIGIHHFHRLVVIGYILGYVQLHPQGSSYQLCLTAVPSRHHASWTLLSRSYSPSLDCAGSQTSSPKRMVLSDAIREAKQDLEETLDDENEEIKRILPPFHHHYLVTRSWRANSPAASRGGSQTAGPR
jgi:hypothetical protein